MRKDGGLCWKKRDKTYRENFVKMSKSTGIFGKKREKIIGEDRFGKNVEGGGNLLEKEGQNVSSEFCKNVEE
ncbi:hypothetical protein K0M31_011539 [Melipona bicolor]|uniref:Uncharacterized protein n=1 Tax=Melipona bicolor TaxID=60889 RepID=A0AA40G9P9_9HYME|nr:hypothetical protein K0M31_011539 [Melipona bicolor]